MQEDMHIFAAADIRQADCTECGQANGTPAGAVNTRWTQM